MGLKLACNSHDLPDMKLAWAVDFPEDHLVKFKKMYPNVQVTQNYRKFLKPDMDAADIAAPMSAHLPLIMEAQREGDEVVRRRVFLVKTPCSYGNQITREQGTRSSCFRTCFGPKRFV